MTTKEFKALITKAAKSNLEADGKHLVKRARQFTTYSEFIQNLSKAQREKVRGWVAQNN